MFDMFSRVEFPQEILHDLGIQFVSEVMKEVSRLLSMEQLTSTPYHPICNGLIERFNGTLKQMLKRLCADESQDCGRYSNALTENYHTRVLVFLPLSCYMVGLCVVPCKF